MATSRAAVLTGPRSIEIQDLEVPSELPPGWALIEVEGNGICGSDYDSYVGRLRIYEDSDGNWIPQVLGHEAVGRILKIDPDRATYWNVGVGDRVAVDTWSRCGQCPECRIGQGNHCRSANAERSYGASTTELLGGIAECMAVSPRRGFYKLPESLSVEDCVLFNPLGNAFEWTCRAGQVRPGDRVLILGGGQRGLACVIAAKEAGASLIVVTGLGRDAHKLALAKEFGAHEVIVVDREDVRTRGVELTDGMLFDVAVDLVPGVPETIADAIELVRFGGRVSLAGVKGRPIEGLVTDRIWQKDLTITGSFGMSPWAIENANRIICSGEYDFTNVHSHTLPIAETDKALRLLGGELPDESPFHITIVPG